jgi:hypothetical protein
MPHLGGVIGLTGITMKGFTRKCRMQGLLGNTEFARQGFNLTQGVFAVVLQ